MRLKYTLILFFTFIIYNIIMLLIKEGFLFVEDSHVRGFYIVFVPYYFVLFLMSLFYRYKIITIFCIIPISILVWKISDILMFDGPESINIDLLLIISSILLICINELIFFLKRDG